MGSRVDIGRLVRYERLAVIGEVPLVAYDQVPRFACERVHQRLEHHLAALIDDEGR